MLVAWVLGCMFAATLLGLLLQMLALHCLQSVFPEKTTEPPLNNYLSGAGPPGVGLLAGILLGFLLVKRFPEPPAWVGWFFLLLAIPPGFWVLSLTALGGESAWAEVSENLLSALLLLLPLCLMLGFLACGLALLTGMNPVLQAWVFAVGGSVIAGMVGISKLRATLDRWRTPRAPGSAQYQVTVDPPTNEDERFCQVQSGGPANSAPAIAGACFSLDGKYLCYTNCWNLNTYVWEAATGRRTTLPERAVWEMAWAPVTHLLAIHSHQAQGIVIYAPPEWQPICVVRDTELFTDIFCWSPTGKELAFRRSTREIGVWHEGENATVRTYPLPSELVVNGKMAWSADGRRLVVAGAQAGAYVLDLPSGDFSLIPQLEPRGGAMHGVAISPDGEQIALQSYRGAMQFGLVALYGEGGARLEQKIRLRMGTEGGSRLRWSPDGAYLAIWERQTQTERIVLFRIRPFQKVAALQSQPHESWKECTWTEDGQGIDGVRDDGVVWRWDLSTLVD